MTKYIAYSIKDEKTENYGFPMFDINPFVFFRKFKSQLRQIDKEHAYLTNPEDFRIYKVGYYDDITAKFVSSETPELLTELKDLIDE